MSKSGRPNRRAQAYIRGVHARSRAREYERNCIIDPLEAKLDEILQRLGALEKKARPKAIKKCVKK